MNWNRRKSQFLMATAALATMACSPTDSAAQFITSETTDFGNVPIGQSTEQVLQYSVALHSQASGGCAKGVIFDSVKIRMQVGNADEFQIVSDNLTGNTLLHSAATFTVHFAPNSIGPVRAYIQVVTHGAGGYCAYSPSYKYLTGAGAIGQSSLPQQPPTPPVRPVNNALQVYIFVEGARLSSDDLNGPVLVYLKSLQSIKYDQMGDSGSSNVKYATHKDIDKIKSYIQTLPKDTKVYLIGHSWGGYVATQIAATPGMRKIEELITIDPVDKDFDSSAPSDRNRPPATTNRSLLFAAARANTEQWIDVDATLDDSKDNSSRWDEGVGPLGFKSYLFGSDAIANAGGDWGLDPKPYATSLIQNDTVHHSQLKEMMLLVPLNIIQPALP